VERNARDADVRPVVTNGRRRGISGTVAPPCQVGHFSSRRAPWAGTLSTAGGLIFCGDEDGYLMAFDARSGKNLWKINTGNRLVTSPITYMLSGRQYITMPSGSALLTFALPE